MGKNRKAGGARKIGELGGSRVARINISSDSDEPNVRCLTNNFMNVRLVSLASWREANKIFLWDRGAPYIVTQEGCDPEDLTMTPGEFVLGRSGKWLPLGVFFVMPIAERWQEFIFATAGEVLRMMRDFPSAAVVWRPTPHIMGAMTSIETDEMAAAYHSGKTDWVRATQ
jgi:hypothetical protein